LLAAGPADRLLGLADGLGGHRAGVDDQRIADPGLKGGRLHDLGFIGVEPAAEGQGFDPGLCTLAHATTRSRAHSPVCGSSWPKNSNAAGPVSRTWSSLRQWITRSPPGRVTVALRSVRLVR